MMRIFIVVLTLTILLGFSMKSNADLNLIGQGTSVHGTYNLIYDTDLDITWYDFINVNSNWWFQVDWANNLTVNFGSNIYDDWRLPVTFDHSCQDYNCTNSEMGHLYYTELGNSAGGPLTNTGDFQNLRSDLYWSDTEYAAFGAWAFSFFNGYQEKDLKGYDILPGIAVRSGLAVVPEPISSILFVIGGTLLAGGRLLRNERIRARGHNIRRSMDSDKE